MTRIGKNGLAETLSASVRGANHIRDLKECQDAVSIKEGTFEGEPYLVCSIGDGHGGDDYNMSSAGSLLAALAAEKTAIQYLLTQNSFCEDRGEMFGQHISWHLKREWEENIRQSWDQFRIDQGLVKRHGTTILSVFIYGGYAYMAQLGDGDICYLDREGNPVFLIEPENGPVSSETASLCSRNANNNWNFACIPVKDITFLMMSTDGLINSMASNDEYVKFAKALQGYLGKFRPSEINTELPAWLSDYSENGCGDDISLVAIGTATNHNPGEKNNENTDDTRTQNHKKTGGGRTGGSVPCRKKRTLFRLKALQRFQRHPGSEKYYLLPRAGRRAGSRLRK